MIRYILNSALVLLAVTFSNAQSIQEQLQNKLNEIQQRDSLFGITAAVMLGDDTLWIGSAGYSDPTTMDPATTDMNCSIGSNTKMMTSAIILQLVNEGKLSFDDTIDEWFTPTNKIPGNVTVRQLLNHTSGIADYTTEEWVDSFKVNPARVWTFEEIVDVFVGEPDFLPGTSWKYSNTGYFLLGKIIEFVEAESYREVLYERIINPLNLITMYTPIEDEPTGPVMVPWFDINDDGIQDNLLNYSLMAMHTSAWAAGYVYSTPIDLAKFLRGLFTNNIINGSKLTEMKTAVSATQSYDYGLAQLRHN